MCTDGSDLADWFRKFDERVDIDVGAPIIPEIWLHSAYRPTRNIIDAATALYKRQNVREISHRYAQNLDETINMLAN